MTSRHEPQWGHGVTAVETAYACVEACTVALPQWGHACCHVWRSSTALAAANPGTKRQMCRWAIA